MRVTAFLAVAILITVARAAADERDDLKPVIDKAVKAAGGDKLTGLKAWTQTNRFKSADGTTVIFRQSVELPDRQRMEMESEKDGKKSVHVSVLAGDKGWSKEPDGPVKDMPAESVAGRKQYLGIIGFRTVVILKHPDYTLSPLGESKDGDRAVVGVKAVRGKDDEQRLYFDKETGRLVKVVATSSREGKEVVHESLFEDFKVVDGILIPHKRVNKRDGKVDSVSELVEFKAADKLDPKLFEKP